SSLWGSLSFLRTRVNGLPSATPLASPSSIAPHSTCHLCVVFLFLALQPSERGPDNLAGVFVTAAFDPGQHEPVQLVRKINVAGRHTHLLERKSDSYGSVSSLASIANH